MFISTAYAVFSSELIISGEGIVEKDNIAPTCGAWYLRDSNLSIQEAYNQNKFKNPSTNTTWTNENQKLFIECTDNMDGDYGCINVTEITDSNNQKRYYKEVKEYSSSVKTDSNIVTVTLKDAYLNERTCSLPVGGSNPYLDKTGPKITITPTSYNKFTYSAIDDIGVTGYMVTTTPVEPTLDDSNWITDPVEVLIDNTEAHTYYVWAKDGVNITNKTISSYLLTKDEGEGTTLTLKYKNSTGVDLTTGYVLNETKIYISASLNTGYNNLTITKNNVNISNPSTITVEGNTTIASEADFDGIYVTFDPDGGTVSPTKKGVISGNIYGELPIPEKSGYAFAGWSELPSGYTPLEYIESTGTQWIDTGTKFNSNSDKFELIFKANDSNGNYFIAGSGYSEKGKIWVYNWNSGNRFAMYINDTNGTQREFIGLNAIDAQKHKVTFDAKKLYVDESLTADGSSYTFGDTPYNFSLFNALNSTGYIAKTKIYSFKMWKSGVLMRNMVPVINNSTGKAGLYDLVSNTFYGNDGTGEFITGPRNFITSTSIVQKTTDHTLTAIWDKKFVVTFDPNGGSVNPTTKEVVYKNEYGELPVPSKTNYSFNNWVSSNYQELYYIESTGTQYIDTNYYVTNKTAIDVDYKFNILTQQQRVYGVAGDVSFQFYINSADSWAYSHQDTSGNWFNTSVKADMKKHNLKFNVTSGKVLIDNGSSYNADINGSVTKTANYPLYIMVNNETGTVNCQGTERIYYFKIYENGVLVRDYIPVRRLSDNSLGLLDKITNTFYPNAGTGTFIAGPEINRKVVDSATLVTTYGDHTLFAKWDNIYKLSINPNGGTYNSSSGVTTASVKYPEVYNVLNPIRSGYTFLGWNELSSTNSSTGLSDIAVYNNKGNGVVTVTSQSKSSDNPLSTTANEYKIVNSGSAEASPGLGGFRQTMQTEPNHVYVHVFVAKLPVGYYFYEAYNPLGTGFSVEWLTSNEGTGKWQTYAYKVKSGSSGSFSTMGFVYATKTISNIWDGAVAETGSYTAYLAYSSIFDVTANNNGIGQLDGTASLTARWGTTLTANPNGGSFNGSTSNTTYTKDVNSLQVLPYPTRTGYTFNGWTKSGGGTVTKYGKPLYTDDTFNSGANSMSVYNNSANGTVTHTRVATTSDNPLKKSSYVMKITTNGTASPGLGGFVQYATSRANAVFYHVIVAKIPIGYTIQYAANQTGTGRTIEWLTSQAGTGKYETYIYKHTCGSSGTFSTLGHVYLSGNAATSTNPVTWYVAFANMFDYSSGTPNNSSQVFTYGDTNTTVTANWSVNSYTLTYNNNGGSGCSSKTGTYGSTWGSLCTPSRSGYTFQGWYTAASGGTKVTSSTTVSGNQTVYAHWNLSSVFAYLGQGTSFNIKSKYPLIYDKLNANNFIISVSSMPSISAAGQTNMHQYITGNLTGFNLSKSYNASTGVLTISGNGFKIYGCYDDSYVNCSDASASGTVSPYVYLNYNYSTVYDLGTGTSFNIKSKYPSLYSSLTANNFIVGTTSISNLHTEGWTNPHRYLSGKTSGFNITKSYNASTGILTVSGNSYNLQFCGDDSYLYCADANVPGSFSPRVYLYK